MRRMTLAISSLCALPLLAAVPDVDPQPAASEVAVAGPVAVVAGAAGVQDGAGCDGIYRGAGGGDPAALIRRYVDRVAHVHLKDVALDPVEFLPLGQGSLDFRDILSAVREAGYDSWLIVELDAYAGDPLEAAKISKAYLDQLLTIQVA